MTYRDVLENASEEERCYYVYMWVVDAGDVELPFYVGKGKGARWKSKASRSKTFLKFLETHNCRPVKAVDHLTNEVALVIEKQLKNKFIECGFPLLDGEENEAERIKRQKEGIACARERGVKFGRPEKDVDCVLLDGETVRDACKRLGVSKTYWYEKQKDRRPRSKGSGDLIENTPEAC